MKTLEKKPDANQQKVIDAVEHGIGNMVVNARAGSGKTYTITEALKKIPAGSDVLFVAFNNSIVNKLNEEIGDKPGTKILTYHSLGGRILYTHTKKENNLSELKYHTYVTTHVNELSHGAANRVSKSKRNQYIRNVISLVDFARFNLMQNEREMAKLCQKYAIAPILNECEAAVKVLRWGIDYTEKIDYTDMVWMVVEKKLRSPAYMFDYIFIDEAQDSSPAQQALFKQCLRSNGRCIMVGDEHQCINAWCGSDVMAFKTLMKIPNTRIEELPISHRCSKKVVEMAKILVPSIESDPNAVEGSAGLMANLNDVKIGDMVLCRTTEPLVRLQMKNIKEGKKSYIIGRKIGEEIIDKIMDSGESEISADLSKKGVVPHLYYDLFCMAKKLSDINKISEYEVLSLPQIVNMLDLIKTIEAISDGLNTPSEVEERIKKIFISERGKVKFDDRLLPPEEYITLSTIHKAKGLESDNVFLACPSMLPSPFATTEMEKRTEMNLEYVAITRAKVNFYKLNEKELRPTSLWSSHQDLSSSLKKVVDKVLELYGPVTYELSDEEKYQLLSGKKIEKTEDRKTKVIPGRAKNKPKFTKFI